MAPNASTPPSLSEIRARVAGYVPRLEPQPTSSRRQAAVALIVHELEEGPELLFIERAARDGDPWSGQMALPGGRWEPSDPDLGVTAARETFEEVGVELPTPVGRLDDFSNARQVRRVEQVERVCVSTYVYELTSRPRTRRNHEVASTVWIPLRWILHPQSASTYELSHEVWAGTFPAFVFERYKVWGMTYRILECLAAVLDRQLPARQVYPGPFADEDGERS